MVATRNHPSDFPEPSATTTQESPRKRTTRNSTPATTALPNKSKGEAYTVIEREGGSQAPATPTSTSDKPLWSHTPSNLTLIWLAISLPLVVWDTGYVLLRPHSMPGGALHEPIWKPYKLYGEVDHTYGFKAYNENNGWTAAQGSVNALETAAYLVYLYLVYTYGQEEATQGRGAPDQSVMGRFKALSRSRTVYGRMGAWVVILGFSVATVTFWKTILYWLIEYFSGFEQIGHNDFVSLLFLWILPNGAWLGFPAYMVYVFGKEILQGLESATGNSKKSD